MSGYQTKYIGEQVNSKGKIAYETDIKFPNLTCNGLGALLRF